MVLKVLRYWKQRGAELAQQEQPIVFEAASVYEPSCSMGAEIRPDSSPTKRFTRASLERNQIDKVQRVKPHARIATGILFDLLVMMWRSTGKICMWELLSAVHKEWKASPRHRRNDELQVTTPRIEHACCLEADCGQSLLRES